MSQLTRIASAVLLSMFVATCGQKGPLYLPEQENFVFAASQAVFWANTHRQRAAHDLVVAP